MTMKMHLTLGRRNMARVNLKGLKKVTRTLADGSKQIFYYAWVGGPLLKNKDGSPAQPHQASFVREKT